jgi:hypothetical protein
MGPAGAREHVYRLGIALSILPCSAVVTAMGVGAAALVGFTSSLKGRIQSQNSCGHTWHSLILRPSVMRVLNSSLTLLTTCIIGTPPIIIFSRGSLFGFVVGFVAALFLFCFGLFFLVFVSFSAHRQFKPVGGTSGHVVGRDQLRHFPSDVLLQLFPHDACLVPRSK